MTKFRKFSNSILMVAFNKIKMLNIGSKVIFKTKDRSIKEGIITYSRRDNNFIEKGFDDLYPDYISYFPITIVYCKDDKKSYRLKY